MDKISLADLQWLLPIAVGSLAFFVLTLAVALGRSGWPVAVTACLAAALIGAGVWTKVTLGKDGLVIETTARAALNTAETVGKLSETVKANGEALSKLAAQVDSLATLVQTAAASPTAPPGLSQQADKLRVDSDALRKIVNSNAVRLDQLNDANQAIMKDVGALRNLGILR